MKFEYKNKRGELKPTTTDVLSIDFENGHMLTVETTKAGMLGIALREKSGKKLLDESVDGFVMRFKKGDK